VNGLRAPTAALPQCSVTRQSARWNNEWALRSSTRFLKSPRGTQTSPQRHGLRTSPGSNKRSINSGERLSQSLALSASSAATATGQTDKHTRLAPDLTASAAFFVQSGFVPLRGLLQGRLGGFAGPRRRSAHDRPARRGRFPQRLGESCALETWDCLDLGCSQSRPRLLEPWAGWRVLDGVPYEYPQHRAHEPCESDC